MFWVLLVAGIFVLLTALLVFCVAPGKMTAEAKKASQVFYGLNCAHRGLYTKDQQIPENSIPAFSAARHGSYGVELDVQFSKDEQVVVFHDDDLKRVCGVDKPVNSMDFNELSALCLFDSNKRIPLLTEVLKELGDTPVIVEIKSFCPNYIKLCEDTLKLMRAYGQRWCVESFDPRVVAWFKKNAPDIFRGQLSRPPGSLAGVSKPASLLFGYLLTNFLSRPHFIAYENTTYPLTVRLCRAMKPIKVVWTVIPDHDIKRCEKENDTVIFEHYEPLPRFK